RLSPVADQGQNSAAMQLSDAMFTIVFVGMAGSIFGSGQGEPTPGQSVAPTWVFLLILGVMAGVAACGAWAAGRIADPARDHGRAARGTGGSGRSGRGRRLGARAGTYRRV